MAFDYVADGQMSIFDFVTINQPKFEPIEEFAKIIHMAGRQQRIADYFKEHIELKERVSFLKHEYDYGGGYGRNKDKAYTIFEYESTPQKCYCKYNMIADGKMHEVTSEFGYETLAKTIDLMIKENRYAKT